MGTLEADVRRELPRLAWSERYSVGVAEIDAQHRELFARINAFVEAADARRARHELTPLVEFLGNYAHQHFADEERMMQFAGYPELGEHLEQHQSFLTEWRRLSDALGGGGPTLELARDLVELLFLWVNEHVLRQDQELGRWLSSRRSAPPHA